MIRWCKIVQKSDYCPGRTGRTLQGGLITAHGQNEETVRLQGFVQLCENTHVTLTMHYLTREYYNRDKVVGFGRFRHIFPGQKFYQS